ncbi:MAG: Holliday junction branch migration protein RuvA [Rhodobiaceae bacterium]|nr:Holliday junction branch migration protein RuvA [Rhodobiaceae bacterium]MCC0053319.1 Holliday junction branch migration protein RuvA [Rhodobiaceae bacterium]
MISKLKGLIDEYGDHHVVIDVNGVGYILSCSGRTLSALPQVGEAATIFVETTVIQEQIRLYGFASALERQWFRLLMTVQGVGAKVALSILSSASVSDLSSAIAMQDKAMVARAPGVGPKVAGRIVSELRDKAPGFIEGDVAAFAQVSGAVAVGAPSATRDAVSALVNLGYGQAQAGAAVATAYREGGEDASTETLIRLALKALSR